MPGFASFPSLKDRAVFVSGGGSGIGASIVEHFAEQGAKVAFVDIDEAASKALLEKIAGAGHPAPSFAKCDVRDIAAYQATIAALAARLGDFTVLVNNAARDDRHALEEVTPAYWDERMSVNLRHQYFAIQSVVPGMKSAVAVGAGWASRVVLFIHPVRVRPSARISAATRVILRLIMLHTSSWRYCCPMRRNYTTINPLRDRNSIRR